MAEIYAKLNGMAAGRSQRQDDRTARGHVFSCFHTMFVCSGNAVCYLPALW